MQKPIYRTPLRLTLGMAYYGTLRKLHWVTHRNQFAHHFRETPLPYCSATHKTLLRRKLKDVEMYLQENKITNLQLAAAKINGIVLKPGETFSYWNLVGKPTKAKGLSVPDADTLLAIGQLFETPVSQLLDEDIYLPVQGDTTTILSQQLARVNEQLARNLAWQRTIVRVLSMLGLVILSLIALVPLLHTLSAHIFFAAQDVAVIGGADGPTAVYITSADPNFVGIALFIGAVCLCAYGIYATRRK